MNMRGWSATLAGLVLLTSMSGCAGTSPAYEAAQAAGWNQYGATMNAKGREVSLGMLSGNEKNVIVTATIEEICPKKGCWMTVKDEAGDEIMVFFKDYAFFVPRNASGRKVVMHGLAERRIISVDELRHYAEDARRSAEEIAAITEPEDRVFFHADSVFIEGSGLDAPHTQ